MKKIDIIQGGIFFLLGFIIGFYLTTKIVERRLDELEKRHNEFNIDYQNYEYNEGNNSKRLKDWRDAETQVTHLTAELKQLEAEQGKINVLTPDQTAIEDEAPLLPF